MLLYTKNYRKVFLVSKKILNFLAEPISLYKEIVISTCGSCPFKDSANKYAQDYCKNFCNKNYEGVISIPKYGYCNMHLRKPSYIVKRPISRTILKEVRLRRLTQKKYTYATPLQSKLMLAYFHLANNKGIINLVSKKYIAYFVGCSTKSIDNCNKILEKYKLIKYQVNEKNELTVVINNYEDQHVDDGTGYVVIASNLFEKILDISGLHEMRIALKAILLYDANKHFGNKTSFSLERLRNFLPSYKQKKYKLKAFLKNILKLFQDGLQAHPHMNTGIEFTIDDKYDGKSIRKELLNKYDHSFKEHISKRSPAIPRVDEKARSLAQLSLEYEFKDVLEVVAAAPLDIIFLDVKNLASYIRYYIKKSQQMKECFFEIV